MKKKESPPGKKTHNSKRGDPGKHVLYKRNAMGVYWEASEVTT